MNVIQADAPPEHGRLFYEIQQRSDEMVDVFLMPFVGVKLVVRGIEPFDGLEDDIRARYYSWCESAQPARIGGEGL